MKARNLFLTSSTLFLLYCLLRFPQELLQKAIESVNLWFQLVLPSLFPFLTATGILIRLGVAHKFGQLFQPFMQPVFHLSGICAFPLILGMISGYPSGAKITVTLCQKKALSPKLFFGFFYKKTNIAANSASYAISVTEPTGKILSDSVADAMETVTQIGGFIILFGVIIEALQQTGIMLLLTQFFCGILPLSSAVVAGILGGILEMTNGASLLSQAPEPTQIQLVCITAILSFGGLSILAQTLGILSPLSIYSIKYIFSKGINSIFSALVCFFCYPIFQEKLIKAVSVSSFPTKTASYPYFSFSFFFLLFSLFLLSCHHQK